MFETLTSVTVRCRLLLLVSCSLLFPVITPAAHGHAAKDPLETGARHSDRAARSLLLSIVSAGNRLVAVGERGIIVYSDDDGKKWSQAEVPVSVTLTSVYFVNAAKGWAVGHDGVILASVDGGKTWTKKFDGNQANAMLMDEAQQNVRIAAGVGAAAVEKANYALEDVKASAKFGPSRPMLGVWFKNETEGFVAGSYGQIFQTKNGGDSWALLSARFNNPDGLHYNAITQTAGGALVIAGEAGKVYRSTDDGASWQTLDTGYQGQFYGVLGTDSGNGIEALLAFGFAGHIFRTVDDGKSWQEIVTKNTKSLVGGARLSDGSLLLAAQDGTLLRSDDQGRSFQIAAPGSNLSIASMLLLTSGQQVALAGEGGIHFISTIPSAGRAK